METVKKFKELQDKKIQLLRNLQLFLEEGTNLGVEIDPYLTKKIKVAIDDVHSDKLKLVLVGGFSEGKTSIAAAWLERLDQKTMKISERESSNEVKVYNVTDQPIQLIDTPGLFGFKEKLNPDTSAIEKYKEITKKYVSEAHIVLYVLNPKNPIKDSHSDDLKWLFRDLNLLSRTIFVLSRFDEVADIEDEKDYYNNLKIKKENVINRLDEIISLSSQEKKEIVVVAVSANPFNLGIGKWLNESNEFKKLSHINSLENETKSIIGKKGDFSSFVYEAQNSIISDILKKQIPVAREKNKSILSEILLLEKAKNRLSADRTKLDEKVKEAKKNLNDAIINYFTQLIRKIRGCTPETLGDFFSREVGEEGCIINSRIHEFFEEVTADVSIELNRIETKFLGEINHYNSVLSSLGKQGTKFGINNLKVSNKIILKGRDFFKLPIKFKPWGALKLAKGINAGLAGVGLAFELFDSYKQHKASQKFEKSINQCVDFFEGQRKELLSIVSDKDFNIQFFPDFNQILEYGKEIDGKLDEYKQYQKSFDLWCNKGNDLEKQFRLLLK